MLLFKLYYRSIWGVYSMGSGNASDIIPLIPPRHVCVSVCVAVWHAVVVTSWRKSAISTINPDQLWFPYVQGFWDCQCIIDNLIAVLKAEADALIIPDFSWKAPASHTNQSWEIKLKTKQQQKKITHTKHSKRRLHFVYCIHFSLHAL